MLSDDRQIELHIFYDAAEEGSYLRILEGVCGTCSRLIKQDWDL